MKETLFFLTIFSFVCIAFMQANGSAAYTFSNSSTLSTSTPPSIEPKKEGNVSGIILDGETNEPIPAATIRVLDPKDSTLVTGFSSGLEGKFSGRVKLGNYLAQFTFVGYTEVYRPFTLSPDRASLHLDTIILYEGSILLDEAVVTAPLQELVVKGDTLEYNADYFKVTEVAVVEDLLKQMTGVEIDTDGTITVEGKEIKKILVDGKEFFSDDPKIASKNLPAKMVDKLQVLDNKSEMEKMTGFDDGEEEMVINLTVKPEMRRGTFGNVFAGYGSSDRYEANALVNHMQNSDQLSFVGGVNNTNNAGASDLAVSMDNGRGSRGGSGAGGGRSGGGGGGITESGNAGVNLNKEFSKELQVGGNIRYGGNHTEATSRRYTQNFLSGGDTFEDEKNRSSNEGQNFNFDLRLEWRPDSMTTLVFRPNASRSGTSRSEQGEFSTTRDTGDTINFGHSEYYSEANGGSAGGSLSFHRRLGKIGRTVSLSLNGGSNHSESKGVNLSSTYYRSMRPDDLIDQRVTDNNESRNWSGAISYVEPVGNQKYLQLSYNYRQNSSLTEKDTRTRDEEGEYTLFDTNYSRLNDNSSTSQEISLSFRSRAEKYNYSVGFHVHPSASHRKTYVGDSIISNITQNVTNYSPTAQFNYLWSRQKNLRFTYNGSTQQPSVNQISPVTDITDPLNITFGNPDLKPSFRHSASIRFQNSQPQQRRFYMWNSTFNQTINAIVTSRYTDIETGRKENTYRNVNGNWNANTRFTTTQPIIGNKLSVSSTTSANYSRSNGFSNHEENVSRQTNLSQNLNVRLNTEKIQFSIRGNVAYNKVKNSLEGQQDREYFNYATSANTTLFLPYDWNIQSDIRYSTNSGYSDGYKEQEVLWNASVEKQVLKQKNGLVRVKVYDILQQRSNIRRNVSSNYIRDTTSNTLTSYFIVHFVYRFNVFSGGASPRDNRRREGGRESGATSRYRGN